MSLVFLFLFAEQPQGFPFPIPAPLEASLLTVCELMVVYGPVCNFLEGEQLLPEEHSVGLSSDNSRSALSLSPLQPTHRTP